jgi:3-oxoacyl-[acyl-carrier-protein] synthase II
MERQRIVITGLGTVNPLGNSVGAYWDGLVAGKSGIGKITNFDASDLPCQIAGEVKDFDPSEYMDHKEARRAARSTQFAIAAATQAIADAGLPSIMPDPERAGVMIGTGVGGIEQIIFSDHVLRERTYRRMNPFQMPSGIPNIPAFQIAQIFQCLGPNNTTTTACAAGTQAVGEGAEMIRRGVADIVIAGGTEAIVFDLTIAGFSAMRALPFNYNDHPQEASRPFDAAREGFILSEGSAMLVLESLEHALDRGARIYAEFGGHASSSDGFHMAALKPDGLGPLRAMRWAVEDAGLDLADVDYINAHGTSTPLNDSIETLAIKNLFGEGAYYIPISSTKSMIGHPMGAAGALEAMACVLTIANSVIPPTINYQTPDPECDLNYVPNVALQQEVHVTLSNSFGLGGQNACLVLKKYQPEA